MAGRPEEELEKLFEDALRDVLKKEGAEGLPERLGQGREGPGVPYEGDQI